MVGTLRPSRQAFEDAGWLPKSQEAYERYIGRLCDRTGYTLGSPNAPELLDAVAKFKEFVEGNALVRMDFERMFENMRDEPRSFDSYIKMINEIFQEAPGFGDLGPPLYMIMAHIMNTQGGFSGFTKENLNAHFKTMFVTWSDYLLTKASTSVLNQTEPNGWLTATAQEALLKEFAPGRAFYQVYNCPDISASDYGFESFDHFFNRTFANPGIDRPTGEIDNPAIISTACESVCYALQSNVQKEDLLFIKDEAYSLVHLLNNDPSVDSFVGGNIIQGFLQTTGYHRWHAPVNGTIAKIVDVPGTYFVQCPELLGVPMDHHGITPPYLLSLRMVSNIAARQLIFIRADYESIGLMCFIAIGMTEISTCQATVTIGQKVKRGDELGMFHFGGSSSAMVFRPEAGVQWDAVKTEIGATLKINSAIGVAAISG
jgi:phosphatidylserine decarboxylase